MWNASFVSTHSMHCQRRGLFFVLFQQRMHCSNTRCGMSAFCSTAQNAWEQDEGWDVHCQLMDPFSCGGSAKHALVKCAACGFLGRVTVPLFSYPAEHERRSMKCLCFRFKAQYSFLEYQRLRVYYARRVTDEGGPSLIYCNRAYIGDEVWSASCLFRASGCNGELWRMKRRLLERRGTFFVFFQQSRH